MDESRETNREGKRDLNFLEKRIRVFGINKSN